MKKWEMYLDYDMWADKDFNFHLNKKEDAEKLLELLEKSL